MTKNKLIAAGLVVLGALVGAAYQTGVGTDVINAVCSNVVVKAAPAAVTPAVPVKVDAGAQ